MDPVFHTSIAAGLSLLFAAAAIDKLRDPAHFRDVLKAYQLMPAALAPAAAVVVIGIELLASLAVWLTPLRSPALWTMAALLSIYWLAMAANLARGRRDIDCGCSGPAARQSLSAGLLVRNALLIGLATGGAAGHSSGRELLWLDLVSIPVAVAVGALLYLAANRLLAQAPRLAMLRRS